MTHQASISYFQAVMLGLVALVMFLPGLFVIPPIDRDEPRFAQSAKQMVETGEYIDIRFQGDPRHKKPVGVYWAQAAMIKILDPDMSEGIWVHRLVSVFAMVGVVILTAKTGAVLAGSRAGMLAGLSLASMMLVGVEARLAKTDGLLLLTIMMAMLPVAQSFCGTKPFRILFYAGLGLGLLVKGPVILIPVLGVMAFVSAFRKNITWLASLWVWWGPLLTLMVAAPWYAAITYKTGGDFFAESIGKDLGGKIAKAAEMHGAPPGVHSLLLLVLTWPFAILLPGIIRRFKVWWQEPWALFLVAWVAPVFLVFEMVTTKLPHYPMPAYPAIAILMGAMFGRISQGLGGLFPRILLGLVPTILGLAMVAGSLVLALEPLWLMLCLGVLLTIMGVASGILLPQFVHKMPGSLPQILVALSLVLQVVLLQFFAPRIEPLWLSPRLAERVALLEDQCVGPVGLMGFAEPSAIFLLGTNTQILSQEDLAGFSGIVLTNQQNMPASFQAPGHMVALDLPNIEGMNLNGGKKVSFASWCAHAQKARP